MRDRKDQKAPLMAGLRHVFFIVAVIGVVTALVFVARWYDLEYLFDRTMRSIEANGLLATIGEIDWRSVVVNFYWKLEKVLRLNGAIDAQTAYLSLGFLAGFLFYLSRRLSTGFVTGSLIGRDAFVVARIVSCASPIAILLIFLYSLFLDRVHNEDINAFLYLGSRLQHGELLYVNDFETKLPLVQYVFSIASALGGIGAWRVMTFLFATGSSIVGSYFLVSSIPGRMRVQNAGRLELTVFFSGLFLVCLYSLPEAESAQLEMVAASAAYVALGLTIAKQGTPSSFGGMFAGGSLLSVAALVRPNYVYLLPLYAFWVLLNRGASNRGGFDFNGLFWFGTGAVVVVAACFLPYLFVENGITAVVDGLSAIASYSERAGLSEGPIDLVVSQTRDDESGALFISLYLQCMVAATFCCLRGRSSFSEHPWQWCVLLSVLSVLLLDSSLVNTHYFDHHAIMFTPFLVVLVFAAYQFIGSIERTRAGRVEYHVALVWIGLIMLGLMSLTGYFSGRIATRWRSAFVG